MENFNKKSAEIKNNLIIQFLIFNIILYLFILFVFPRFNFINEVLELFLLLFFLIKYFKNSKNEKYKFEYYMVNFLGKKGISIFEIYAGIITGQFLILLFIFSMRIFVPLFIKATIIAIIFLPLIYIAAIFEEEYKKNRKLIKLYGGQK